MQIKSKKINNLWKILIVILIFNIFPLLNAQGQITVWNITETSVHLTGEDLDATAVGATVILKTPRALEGTNGNGNDVINIQFQDNTGEFDMSAINATSEIDLSTSNSLSGPWTSVDLASVDAWWNWGALPDQTRIILDPDAAIPANNYIKVVYDPLIINPDTSNTYRVNIYTTRSGGGALDQGYAAVSIGNHSVQINASVDPTLTLSVGPATCALGEIESDLVSTCSYNTIIVTNATSGYTAYIREDSDFQTAEPKAIADVADGEVTPTYGEYGLGISLNGAGAELSPDLEEDFPTLGTICSDYNDEVMAMPASPIINTDKPYASAAGPADGSDNGNITLCHGAAASSTTPAGVYSHIVTITIVGNF